MLLRSSNNIKRSPSWILSYRQDRSLALAKPSVLGVERAIPRLMARAAPPCVTNPTSLSDEMQQRLQASSVQLKPAINAGKKNRAPVLACLCLQYYTSYLINVA